MKQNYRFTIRYDGTRYSGWERQKNTDATIQGKLESVLTRLCGYPVTVIGAGRTDAGVHALAMTANALLEAPDGQPPLNAEAVRSYLNMYLPEDIAVLEVSRASDRFHSRFNASGKTYRYTCYVGSSKPVFDRKYVAILDRQPALTPMEEAASLLTGTHDYASFCGNAHMKKSTVRTVDSIRITQKGELLTFTFHGDGFLQNMVRILVGTLLDVGFGKTAASDMPQILAAKTRSASGPMAPAQGLCLVSVDYN
mgnify:CR=1 FL=1